MADNEGKAGENNKRSGFYFEKGFNVTHIVSLAVFVGGLFGVYLALIQQLNTVTSKNEKLQQAFDYQAAEITKLRENTARLDSIKLAYDYQAADLKSLRTALDDVRKEQRETDRGLSSSVGKLTEDMYALRVVIANRGDKR